MDQNLASCNERMEDGLNIHTESSARLSAMPRVSNSYFPHFETALLRKRQRREGAGRGGSRQVGIWRRQEPIYREDQNKP